MISALVGALNDCASKAPSLLETRSIVPSWSTVIVSAFAVVTTVITAASGRVVGSSPS